MFDVDITNLPYIFGNTKDIVCVCVCVYISAGIVCYCIKEWMKDKVFNCWVHKELPLAD